MNIAILGSTGSIGRNAIDVIRKSSSLFTAYALAAHSNITLLEKQARLLKPKIVAVWDEEKACLLRKNLIRLRIKVLSGAAGLIECATAQKVDRVVFSMSGMEALPVVFQAIKARKDIAIANKEPLVSAGKLIVRDARKAGVHLIPIDSEHSAIFQCLASSKKKWLRKIIITASGGPFIDYSYNQLRAVNARDALNHPRWKMGKKITIDSATLMNKGLEVIEAANLYDVDVSKIDVIIHRESIVHSLVEFVDGSILAQLSDTDMRFPISYALSYPERLPNSFKSLDLNSIKKLSFEAPKIDMFKCLALAYNAVRLGKTYPTVLNAANEVAVGHFLNGTIHFLDIPTLIQRVMKKHRVHQRCTLDAIVKSDYWARKEADTLCLGLYSR